VNPDVFRDLAQAVSVAVREGYGLVAGLSENLLERWSHRFTLASWDLGSELPAGAVALDKRHAPEIGLPAGIPQGAPIVAVVDELAVTRLRGAAVRRKLPQKPSHGEKAWSRIDARRGAVTAPPPLLGGANPGSLRIQSDVARQLEQVRILLHENRLVAALEQMA
jgi:hypothetical protein